MPQKTDPYLVEAGVRILDVLELFRADGEPVTLADVAARLGMIKSTAFRMLYTLETKGYIERIPGSRAYRRRTCFRIGFASISSTVPFAMEVNHGIEAAAKRRGMELLTAYNEFDAARAVRNVEEFLAAGVDLIIEYNADEHVSHVIADRCSRANVPVVAITFPVPGATTFGINNYRAGRIGGEGLGEYVARVWRGRLNRAVLLDIAGSSPAQQARMTGMIDGLRSFVRVPDEILLHLHADRFKNDGGRLITGVLAQHPDDHRIVVLSFNDVNALSALEAVRAAGRTADVMILSQGGIREVCQELRSRNSSIWGAVAHHPERFGMNLMPVVERILRRETVPNAIWTEGTLLTRANVARYL